MILDIIFLAIILGAFILMFTVGIKYFNEGFEEEETPASTESTYSIKDEIKR